MPFTFSHPAAVLPFSYLPKKYVSFTGLIVGSIIPDFEYFIHMKDVSYYSHTWAGVFWYDLPFGIIVCFLFHNLVRDSIIPQLPEFVAARCLHCFRFNWNNWFRKKWAVIILCIIVGTASHLIWDQLTHETTHTIEQTNYIKSKSLPAKEIIVYYTYWGLNSIVGILLLAVSFYKMPEQKNSIILPANKNYWPLVLLLSSIILMVRFIIKPENNLVTIIDSCIAAFLFALLLTSLWQRKKTILYE